MRIPEMRFVIAMVSRLRNQELFRASREDDEEKGCCDCLRLHSAALMCDLNELNSM